MVQPILHYGIHFVFPLLIAFVCFRKNWLKAYTIMALAIIIDLDHLLATPIFDPTRCSINFHPLHSYYAMGIYLVLALIKKTRLIGIGLLIHMLADVVDCWMM
ncbi:DUF6122 family protein [Psychroserpens sp. SPM9]|uniref:DUF6122 family protein n=1 Tax=Psychroserpens sp. SPM9 TaxID=2975598 RepID=UPI0021A8C7B3|nr:DUF6122 family protein [Psychroserpens sp. SPM9]MDG5491513.1 DUF6122 family protein [Psychroserpens sp. SPM9]